ncbi:response regulator [Cupriavidus sp. D39]|uniref:response regulator n=1 Tax=Cupriavidus sp. D39 TaxID=2997877 RepID=UPI0022714E6A|nr:response regulator [Cupriavidus sp. D39]MCY0854998.1 response regulator [Cupriavidus sp. D39]
MKLLIVDDDKRRREKIANLLANKGIAAKEAILEADCTDDATRLLRLQYFDVLILDVVLPKRNPGLATPQHGLDLLSRLNRSPSLRKPGRIIGITAHLEDSASFRSRFQEFCLTVLEAPENSEVWFTPLASAVAYQVSSEISRAIDVSPCEVITVHGIRTFGQWQLRLKRLVEGNIGKVKFNSYRYGYFSTISFLIPLLRASEVERLSQHFRMLIKSPPKGGYVIFCHSFGTYLVAEVLKGMAKTGVNLPLTTLVTAGSVLPSDYDWSPVIDNFGCRIVNDCTDGDYILWLAKLAAPDMGMAGKCGFYGFNNERLMNRYFTGGHSSYFDGENFMSSYWLPLISSKEHAVEVDLREASTLVHEVFEKLVIFIGDNKLLVAASVIGVAVVRVLGMF